MSATSGCAASALRFVSGRFWLRQRIAEARKKHKRASLIGGMLACSVALFVAASGARAEEQTNGNDAWGQVSFKVTGIGKAPDAKRRTPQGRLMAERAAEMAAKRNLGLVVGKVSVEGTDRDKKIFVEAFVRGARVTDKKVLPDGTVQVTLELPLSEVARSFAQMQRLWIRAEENREKLEEVFKKNENDLRAMKTRLETFQEAMEKIEAELKSIQD